MRREFDRCYRAIQIVRHRSHASENPVTATAPVPVDQLPAAARLVADVLSAWMAEASAPFDEEGFPVVIWRTEHLPEIPDDVLNRLDRAAVKQLLVECGFCHPGLPDFSQKVDHVLGRSEEEVGACIHDTARACGGILWLDENGRVRFFNRVELDEADFWRLEDFLLLLAALGWQASRAHLHPSKAPRCFQQLQSVDVRVRALTFLRNSDNVVERTCPDLSATERAQLCRALQNAAKEIVKDGDVQPDGAFAVTVA